MGDDSRALLCSKDREMILASLVDEMHHRIDQLGVPGVDDCLTLLNMTGKLTFTMEGEVSRQLCQMVMPLLKDGLGRLVERFCALEPGEADSECLSDAIQNYAKAISLIANWQFDARCEAAACAEEIKPVEEPRCVEEVKPVEEPRCAEEVKPVAEPCCAEEVKPVEEPCCAEEVKPAEQPCVAETPCAKVPCVEEPPCMKECEEPCTEDKPADQPACTEERPER